MAVDLPLAPASTPRFRLSLAKPNQEQIVLLITIALLIAFGLTLNGFATVNNLLNLLAQHFDPRHSRPRHGADRDQPRHRS